MSKECSNSRVNDSIVLAGLGRGDDCGYASSEGGGWGKAEHKHCVNAFNVMQSYN
jgi:hypothetical protein